MISVDYYSNEIPGLPIDSLVNTLPMLVKTEGYDLGEITIIFCTDEELLELNRQHLSHDYFTDIITFNYTHDQSLRAEFFISLWAVERSAEEESQTIENECLRVLVHGILHCMGYNDGNSDEKSVMRKLEDNFIKMFHVKH